MNVKKYITNNRWHGTLLAMLLAMVMGSCTKELSLHDDKLNGEYADFSLYLTPPGAFTSVGTRAVTDIDQNAINRVTTLVFKDNKLLYSTEGTTTDIDGVKRVQVKLKTSQNESDLFDIMVIGNPPTFNFSVYVGKTKDELKTNFNVSMAGKWMDNQFIMYGEVLQTFIKPTTNNFKIQMLRSLARVDIGMGAYDEATNTWAGLPNFSFVSVEVVNSRDMLAVIPSATTISPTGNVQVSAPTIPAEVKLLGSYSYANEGEITFVNEKGAYIQSSIFIAEAPNDTDRVTLILGGYYDGSKAQSFYRVEMCVPSKDSPGSYDYLNILRNHIYRINVTSISGSGFPSASQAKISAPLNITAELTPIEEGGKGDVIFDGNNYITTDASEVHIYGTPDGVKTYTVFTVKANFPAGVTAQVTGTSGLGVSSITLKNGVPLTVSAKITASVTKDSKYTITVGRLKKEIPVTVQPPVDAHFDFLPYAEVASITIDEPKTWLTLSQNMTYLKSEQKSGYITGGSAGKACFHFDENTATSGEPPRTAQALVFRNNMRGTTRVFFEQVNISGTIVGFFGGEKNSKGYTKNLAAEVIDERGFRIYDDKSIAISPPKTYPWWGFNNKKVVEIVADLGKTTTIDLAKRTDSGVTPPYTIYNTYAARYCYDKNRDTNGNGVLEDSEILWYLPAQNQLMGVFVAYEGTTQFKMVGATLSCWTSTDNNSTGAMTVYFRDGEAFMYYKLQTYTGVRCVRDL